MILHYFSKLLEIFVIIAVQMSKLDNKVIGFESLKDGLNSCSSDLSISKVTVSTYLESDLPLRELGIPFQLY